MRITQANLLKYNYAFVFGTFALFTSFAPLVIVTLLWTIVPSLRDRLYPSIPLLLSIYIGFINSTKLPESDLLVYFNHFILLDKATLQDALYNNLSDTTFQPAYTAFAYFINLIFGPSPECFIFLVTVFSYLLLFSAGDILFSEKGKYLINAKIYYYFILAFYPLIFSQSAHLVRQFLAVSIALYFFVNANDTKKIIFPLFGLILATQVHPIAGLFIPLLLYDIIKARGKKEVTFILLLGIISFLIIFQIKPELLISTGQGFLFEGIDFASRLDDGSSMNIFTFIILISFQATLIYLTLDYGQQRVSGGRIHQLGILILILCLVFYKFPLLRDRLVMLSHMITPFFLAILCIKLKKFKVLLYWLPFILLLTFPITLLNTTWSYQKLSYLLLFGPLSINFVQ